MLVICKILQACQIYLVYIIHSLYKVL